MNQRIRLCESTHLEERARRLWTFGDFGNFVCALGPHRLEDVVLGVEQEALEVLHMRGHCVTLLSAQV